MSKVSMSHVAAVIMVAAAIALSGLVGAQAQAPGGPMPGIGGPPPGVRIGGPDMAAESARQYRERARYPEDTYPLKAGQPDPIRAKITDTPDVWRSLDPKAPVITTWEGRVWGQ